MSSIDHFSFKRLLQLTSNELRLYSKTILIVAATVAVFLTLLPFEASAGTSTYFVILYVGGFIITSFAFNDLHDRRKAHLFLMLPCTNLEKFLSKWLLTTLGYAMGLLLLCCIFSLLSMVINFLLLKSVVPFFDILQSGLWIGIGKYIILQSIVLLGAIIFKKYVLIKTALFIGCLLLLISIFSIMAAWVFCHDCVFSGLSSVMQMIFKGGHFLFWIVLAPFCWYITYLRLTESELR